MSRTTRPGNSTSRAMAGRPQASGAKAALPRQRGLPVKRNSTDVDALLRHVVQIDHIPGPREVVFVAEGAMPYVADWDWLRVALDEVLGLVLPASVVKEVGKVLRGNRVLGRLPVIVRTRGSFQVHAIELVRSRRAKRARVSHRRHT